MGAAGVVLNLTVTRPTGPGYLGVYPSDQARPVVSNVNFDAGETIANRVAVRLSQNGRVTVFGREEGVTLSSHVDIVVDVAGWFTDSSNAAAAGSTFVPLAPFRILDTRDGTGGFPVSRVGPQQSIPVQVAGRGGVPLMTDAQPPNAVVVNLTATGGSQGSYATIWPDGATRPTTSDLNWSSGETIPNLVVAGLGGSGIADLFNAAGCTHVVVDVVGYYTGPQVAPAAAALTGIPDCPPEARTRAAIAYDAARHEVVVFGGVSAEGHVFDDTWTWDGKIWTDRTVRPGPSARTEASMAYDATSQSVVLFGGSTGDPNQPLLSDTWTWDGKNWTARSPATRPPPNGHFPMAYDAARGKVLLLALPYPFDQPQTWTWDGAGWTLEHPAVQPPWNYDANMAYDSTRGRIVLFGGWHNTIAQSDTWTWDGSNWTDAAPAVAPPARFNAGLADDPVLHQLVLFGGNGGNNDTWAWNGVTWAKLSPPNSPPPISSGSMVGDPQAGLVLLFGGFQNYQPSPLSGTWVWDGSNWSPRF